ncbi:MAG: CopK family periplasmic copper-binding protein [Betaproteobacteria bacterium]|nr:MAG: CopK family periplasmic copper-binding protein [Betaproteobacteria bacterium]
MKLRLAQVAAIAVIAAVATSPAHAGHAAREAAKQMVALSDGGTLYVFEGGLMAKEDRYGRATSVKVGTVVEAVDGRKITMTSNEVARLSQLLDLDHRG